MDKGKVIMKRYLLVLLVLAAIVCWLSAPAAAFCITLGDGNPLSASISATGTNSDSGNLLAAEAIFTLNTTLHKLTIQLINTADITGSKVYQTDLLTGLFFTPSATLTPQSASIDGSTLYGTSPQLSATNVGKYWQYKSGLSGLPQGASAGISAAGLGPFGPNGNFKTAGEKLDGINGFEIAPIGYDGTNWKVKKVRDTTLVNHEVDFVLSVATGLTSLELCDLSFHYGTDLTDPNLVPSNPVPVPGALLLLGVGLVRLVGYGRRKRQVVA